MTDAVKDFIKGLEKLERSHSTSELFRDFLEMAYCAHAKLMAPMPKRADELEARYMGIVNRYENKDTIRAFPDLMAIALKAVVGGGVDFFGTVAGEIGALNKNLEQFFTPYPVARMMAEMQIGSLKDDESMAGYFTMGEPACGSGVMVLAAADVIEQQGFDLPTTVLVDAVDLSAQCFYMAYLQLSWRGVSALVHRGNSLSMEMFESAWTLPALYFHARHGHLSFDKRSKTPVSESTPQPAAVEVEPDSNFENEPVYQLALF